MGQIVRARRRLSPRPLCDSGEAPGPTAEERQADSFKRFPGNGETTSQVAARDRDERCRSGESPSLFCTLPPEAGGTIGIGSAAATVQPPHHEDPRISISSISGRARAPALPVAALTGSAGEPGGNATRVFQAGARSTPLTRHSPDGEGTETPRRRTVSSTTGSAAAESSKR